MILDECTGPHYALTWPKFPRPYIIYTYVEKYVDMMFSGNGVRFQFQILFYFHILGPWVYLHSMENCKVVLIWSPVYMASEKSLKIEILFFLFNSLLPVLPGVRQLLNKNSIFRDFSEAIYTGLQIRTTLLHGICYLRLPFFNS